jgi:hypothetical protein
MGHDACPFNLECAAFREGAICREDTFVSWTWRWPHDEAATTLKTWEKMFKIIFWR